MLDTPTPEETARHYSAMLDSVTLINSLVPTTDAEDLDTLDRNVRHLEQMLRNDWWAGYDLAPINAAITAGKQ
jgi:hypothetical protein